MAEKTKIDMDDVNNLDIGEEKGGILKKLNSSTIHMIVDALGFLFMFVYFKGQNSSLKQEIISLRREFEDFQNQTKGYIRYLGSKMIPENEEAKQPKKSVRFSGKDEYKEIQEELVEEEPQTQHRPQSYPQPQQHQQMRPQQQRLPNQPQNQPQQYQQIKQSQFQPQETKQFQPQEMKQPQFQPQQSQEIKEPIKFEQPKMELPRVEELPRVGTEENTTPLPESEDFSEELKDEFKRS